MKMQGGWEETAAHNTLPVPLVPLLLLLWDLTVSCLCSCACRVVEYSWLHKQSANSDGAEAEELAHDDEDGAEDCDGADPVDGEEDDDDDEDPNHQHLSEHTKNLIAHLASLPGFGNTRARISHVPYSGPESVGSTLAELQLPWRSPSSAGATAEGDKEASPSPNPSTATLQRLQPRSVSLRQNHSLSLNRRRGTRTQRTPAWSGQGLFPLAL